jgi:hypothetical protein
MSASAAPAISRNLRLPKNSASPSFIPVLTMTPFDLMLYGDPMHIRQDLWMLPPRTPYSVGFGRDAPSSSC